MAEMLPAEVDNRIVVLTLCRKGGSGHIFTFRVRKMLGWGDPQPEAQNEWPLARSMIFFEGGTQYLFEETQEEILNLLRGGN